MVRLPVLPSPLPDIVRRLPLPLSDLLGCKIYELQYQHAAFSTCDRRWRIRAQLEERGGKKWPCGLDEWFSPEAPTHALAHLPKAQGSRRDARSALAERA